MTTTSRRRIIDGLGFLTGRAVLDGFASELETRLDRAAPPTASAATPALHRLNRTEYAYAIRDLLALDVDVKALLPPDDSSEGFDNIADALGVSPSLIQRYVTSAMKISRCAGGGRRRGVFGFQRQLCVHRARRRANHRHHRPHQPDRNGRHAEPPEDFRLPSGSHCFRAGDARRRSTAVRSGARGARESGIIVRETDHHAGRPPTVSQAGTRGRRRDLDAV